MGLPELSQLNSLFGIDGQVVFTSGADGLPLIEVNNNLASASISLQGAHLFKWQPQGQQPVIWLSEDARFARGKSLRGGIPVCWPWFGAHESQAKFPAHGYARTVMWSVVNVEPVANGATRLVFSLQANDETLAMWPHDTILEYRMTIGTTLELELITTNRDNTPITIGQALHTYFAVGDIRQVNVQGLDGCPYLDKVQNFARSKQQGDIRFDRETDRIYLDSVADCLINDPSMQRRIRISKRGSRSTVVWNPWVEKAEQMGDLGNEGYMHMLCVESANAADDVVTIPAGNEHRLWVCYGLEALS